MISIGYIYLSIMEDESERVSGFKYVDRKLNKTFMMSLRINRNLEKTAAYVEMLNVVLSNYIQLVSNKQWVKYDRLVIYIDDNFEFSLDEMISPDAYIKFIKLRDICGSVDVKTVKNPDENMEYLILLGSLRSKLEELKNGKSSESTE